MVTEQHGVLDVLLTYVPCKSCQCHSCAAYEQTHGLTPVPHSQPKLAALWTKLNAALKPTPYPITTWHTSLIPLRNYE